jgi:hypothetical protein
MDVFKMGKWICLNSRLTIQKTDNGNAINASSDSVRKTNDVLVEEISVASQVQRLFWNTGE